MKSAQLAWPVTPEEGPSGLTSSIDSFGQFGYQRRPFAARNWGHPMHSLCSYPSKIKPGLAHFLVRNFTSPGDTVLDPFAGVGTIPFESCLQGRVGVGNDLSPFAYAVTSAKVDPPSEPELTAKLELFCDLVERQAPGVDLELVEPEIRSFFHDQTCQEVISAQHLLMHTNFGGDRAGRAITAALCHVLHGNRPYALSRRSHGIIPIPPKGEFVYKAVGSAVRDKLDRSQVWNLPDAFQPGEAHLGDAFTLPLAEGSVDAVITSPPFLGTTEFLRQNRVRLWFCGMSYDRQRADKERFVEHRRDLGFYGELLAEWARVLKPAGVLVMHLGVVKKRDMAVEIRPWAESSGFLVHSVLYEPVGHLESHGRTDRGATHTHQFLIAQKLT